jgi:hypothetical protein
MAKKGGSKKGGAKKGGKKRLSRLAGPGVSS